MCSPDHYGIYYEINPWMNVKQPIDPKKALQQWQTLYHTIQECGATIDLMTPVTGWPDMVFTANAGMLYQNKIILPHFKHKERQGEVPYLRTWFVEAGFDIWENAGAAFFEGAGDALFAGDKLFAGYGFRSTRNFYTTTKYLDQNNLVYCELIDPYFYHLDTCFCPLNDQLAIWYPPAFTAASQRSMAAHLELLPVLKVEAEHFACNAVVLKQHIILPTECPQIAAQLKARGFTIHLCEMSEFLKAGGACKCLTLRLQ